MLNLQRSFKVRELVLTYKRNFDSPVKLGSSHDVAQFLQPLLADRPRETLVCLSLAPTNDLVALEYISVGSNNAAYCIPAEIFKGVLLSNASAFILAHNHPSGNTDPSPEDISTARQINKAADTLGLRMLDFMIVTPDHYHSLEADDPLWRTN